MRKLLGTCLFLFVLSSFGLVTPAFAQDGGPSVARQVETLSAQGAERFREGDYEAAIGHFEQAYGLQPVPNLLYNIGRCYEQMEDWDRAITYFERFITAPDVESEAREHAMQRVQSLREIKAATDGQSEVAQDEDPDDPQDPVITPPVAEGPNLTPGFIAAGSGLALIGGGVIFGVMASSNASQISDSSLDYDSRLAARNSARTQGLVADVLYITGAAAGAVGVYLILTAGADDEPAPTARSLFPWIGRDSAGVGFTFGF